MELLQDVQFDHLGGFVFSPEEGTPVMEMDLPAVDESDARARLEAVTDYQEELAAEYAENMIGKTVKIIIDQVAEESEYHFYGRTEGNSMENDDIVKVIEGDGDVGEFHNTRLKGSGPCITMDSVLPSEGRYSGSIPDMGIKNKQKARRSLNRRAF